MWMIIWNWFRGLFGRRNGQHNGVPWVEMTGGSFDDKHGVRVELDWNKEFVEYLKANGITGRTEEEAVHRWLGLIVKDMDKNFEAIGGPSEYS